MKTLVVQGFAGESVTLLVNVKVLSYNLSMEVFFGRSALTMFSGRMKATGYRLKRSGYYYPENIVIIGIVSC